MRIKSIHVGVVFSFFMLALACSPDEPDNRIEHDLTPFVLDTKHLTPPTIPADNELTEQKVRLGRMLFHDDRLSADNSMSCATCHVQSTGFSDTNTFSIGVNGFPGKRQAMVAFNMAYNTNEFFWDGRAHLLRDQAVLPIQDSLEMDLAMADLITRLSAIEEYQDQFIRAFGSSTVTEERIGLALEQFMNSIISVDSKYDKYLRGEVTLSASEERGRELYFAEFNPGFPDSSGADCAHCHGGLNFENDLYMNNGLDSDADFDDYGRELATGNQSDRAKFKVPTLRNIELTPPYMHDGRFNTLEEVVNHYNTGMVMSSTIDPALIYPINSGGLNLSNQDVQDLVAFLKTLTDQEMMNNPDYKSPF
ncbi:cytochrome-c peroxidase [Phaeocystidibacter luteus]|uniref:C-type cytochrome n=1 Tax=Phaeocystidibacter luteus TaxID=911197 RepID=A0A6N6RJN4_9FLAO|nr:cytochrome c peroxidase [Phaeocystidibacter luteus]KAB2807682.1 c-type cytochrome [Phaeocystidibacter luteus]